MGKYLNEYFVASFQKVGTFQIVGNQKQGGNVASYFCTPQGRLLHAVVGPVDAPTLLREARWVEETWKLAWLEAKDNLVRQQAVFRKAHLERLRHEHGMAPVPRTLLSRGVSASDVSLLLDRFTSSAQGRIHWLLASFPLVPLETAYKPIFEKVVGEQVSTSPIAGATGG